MSQTYFPYPAKDAPHCNLWYYGRRAVLGEEQQRFAIDTLADLETLLNHPSFPDRKHIIVYSGRLRDFPLLKAMIASPKWTVVGSKRDFPTPVPEMATFRGDGGFTSSVVSRYVWALPPNGQRALETLRRVYDAYGVGDFATPSSLGQRHLAASLPVGYTFLRSAETYQRFLRDGWVGGRSELYDTGKHFDAYTVDLNSAYPFACGHVPGGVPVWIDPRQDEDDWATWYGEAEFTIPAPGVPFSPLPVRDQAGTTLSFPTAPGTYRTRVWKEEAAAARTIGMTVVRGKACAWQRLTDALHPWSQKAHAKRDDPRIAPQVKLTNVSAIGSFASDGWSVHIEQMGERCGMEPLDERGSPLGYTAVERYRASCAQQPQIASYVWMKIRLWLYAKCVAFGRVRLIASNCDGLAVASLPEEVVLNVGTGLGQVKITRHAYLVAPSNRHLFTPERITTPGTPASQRRHVFAAVSLMPQRE